MATQFASLTPTVRFPAPRQSVRIAYSSQSSLGAIADALTEQPTPVVEATLEQLAATDTPLRELLAERNALMASLNNDTSLGDAAGAHTCRQIDAIDRRIIAADARSPDDAVMKLLMLVQIANDHTLDEGEADGAIAAARQFFGIGYSPMLPDNAPLGMPEGYNPFMRGPWIAWQKAYARFVEADRTANTFYDVDLEPAIHADGAVRAKYPAGYDFASDPTAQAELDAIHYPADWDDRNLANWCNRCDTIADLLKTPAPSSAELAVKLKLFAAEEVYALDCVGEVTAVLVADARRFGRQGAYVVADRTLLAAFSERCRLMGEAEGQGGSNTAHALATELPTDRADVVLWESRASTIEGVLAKLRTAFVERVEEDWAEYAITDPHHPKFTDGVRMGSMYDAMMWSAIEDLGRIAGIDLGQASKAAVSEHTAWLNERNDLLAAADRSEADVSDDEALSRINQLDSMISDTPATSADDVIAKLLLAVEVHAEGAEMATEDMAALVREAKAHLGMGYVYTAEVAA